MADKEFKTPQDALAHYGKKGMRWGIRNEDKPSGDGSSSSSAPKEDPGDGLQKATEAFYASKSKADLQAEGNAKLKEQKNSEFPTKGAAKEAKRGQKADALAARAAEADAKAAELNRQAKELSVSGSRRNYYKKATLNAQRQEQLNIRDDLLKKADQVRAGKLTDNQKKLIIAGSVAAAAGLAIYGNRQYQLHQAGITSQVKKDLHEENLRKSTEEWNAIFGHDPGYTGAGSVYGATGPGFYAGLTSKKIWDRPEFEIPEGTIFQRLSDHIEDSSDYGRVKGAYATFLHNDKKLYGAGGEFGTKNYTVHFTAKGPTRVPTHRTVIAHLKQVKQAEDPSRPFTDADATSLYHTMAGGNWSNSTSQKLFGSLRQFGYSAIVDDMDAGYLGDLPVVFFGDANAASSLPRSDQERLFDSVGVLNLTGKYA